MPQTVDALQYSYYQTKMVRVQQMLCNNRAFRPRLSYVILGREVGPVSTIGNFQLNRKLHKFLLSDMNSNLTNGKLHHLLTTDKRKTSEPPKTHMIQDCVFQSVYRLV